MEELASSLYLLAHSSPKEGRHDTNDASSRPVYPMLVPESRLCAVQPSRGREHRASLLDGQGQAHRTVALHGLWARVLRARGTLMEATKLPEETVERLLKCQRWGVCDAGTADICGVDIKTVHRFQPSRPNGPSASRAGHAGPAGRGRSNWTRCTPNGVGPVSSGCIPPSP